MIPMIRPYALPANSENPAVSWIRPRITVIQPHVWRFANTYEVFAVKKWAFPIAPNP